MGPRFLLVALLALVATHSASAEASVAMATKVSHHKAAEAVRELSGMAIPTRIPARELSVGLGIPKAAEADRELLGVYIPTSTPRRRLRLPYRSE